MQVLFTCDLDGPEEADAIATDKFLVQLTPSPTNFSMAKLDGRDLMQELIKAWGDVDKRNKYEFRLRIVRRKDANLAPLPAADSTTATAGLPTKDAKTTVGAGAGAQTGAETEQELQCKIELLKKEYQTLQ